MHLRENHQLIDKYNKHNWMVKKMKEVSDRFNLYRQQVYYATFNDDSKALVQNLCQQKMYDIPGSSLLYNHNTYVIMGCKQSSSNNSIQKLLLNLIYLIPVPEAPYTIIYINTLAAKYAYGDFKKIFQYLPFQYYKHLDKIIVFQAGFMDKATQWLSFDPFYKFNVSKTYYVSSFQDLAQTSQIDAKTLLEMLPQEVKCQLRSKSSFVTNLLKQQTLMTESVQKSVLSHTTPKNQWLHYNNKQQKPKPNVLQNYQVGKTGAPLILELLLYYFNDHEDQLNIEGLFRKSIDFQVQKKILNELQANNYDFIESITDPHLIANVIKRFLSNLVDPVIPFWLFDIFMILQDGNMEQIVIDKIKKLELTRKMIILLLGDFFIEKVLPYQQENKMNKNNLSIVMGPCLMRSQVPSIKDFIYAKKIVQIMGIIISKFDAIFGNRMERMRTVRQSVIMIEQSSLKQKLGNLHVQSAQSKSQQQEINQSLFIEFMKSLNQPAEKQQTVNVSQSPLKNFRIARSHQNLGFQGQNLAQFNLQLEKQYSLQEQHSNQKAKQQQVVKLSNQVQAVKVQQKNDIKKQYIPIIQLNDDVIEEYAAMQSQAPSKNRYSLQIFQALTKVTGETNFSNYFSNFSHQTSSQPNNTLNIQNQVAYPPISNQQKVEQSPDKAELKETDSFLTFFNPKK